MIFTWIARGLLLLDVLIYFMVGSFLVFDPQNVGIIGIKFVTPETTTAFRVYGGFFYGVAIIGSFGVLSRRWTLPSLVAMMIVSTCIVTMRLSGIVIDGVDERNLSELTDESSGVILAALGLFFYWLDARRRLDPTSIYSPPTTRRW